MQRVELITIYGVRARRQGLSPDAHGRLVESMMMCPFAYFSAGVFAALWLFPNATRKSGFAIAVIAITFSYAVARMADVVP